GRVALLRQCSTEEAPRRGVVWHLKKDGVAGKPAPTMCWVGWRCYDSAPPKKHRAGAWCGI
ncbi:MAG: hypothetical protein KBI47_16375, partial [Armatimonadetes bacterium]|nr:hypothetical protein [Armatimonadota bacterium]